VWVTDGQAQWRSCGERYTIMVAAVVCCSATEHYIFFLFILRLCQHDDGYIDSRPQITVHTDKRSTLLNFSERANELALVATVINTINHCAHSGADVVNESDKYI